MRFTSSKATVREPWRADALVQQHSRLQTSGPGVQETGPQAGPPSGLTHAESAHFAWTARAPA